MVNNNSGWKCIKANRQRRHTCRMSNAHLTMLKLHERIINRYICMYIHTCVSHIDATLINRLLERPRPLKMDSIQCGGNLQN